MALWFEVKGRIGGTPEVSIFGDIGSGGVTAAAFSKEWRAAVGKSRTVHLRISSPGGDCFTGNALHDIVANTVKSGVEVIVFVDGLAASMASFITCGGSRVIIGPSAQFMIHRPSGKGIGESHDMRRTADLLDSLERTMTRGYARKSGKSEETISRWMRAETWWDAEGAVAAGFADAIGDGAELKLAASAFDLSGFQHRLTVTPKTAQEAAVAYWAERKGTPAPVGKDDISDLVPKPKTHEEIWAKFNAEGRGRRPLEGGKK